MAGPTREEERHFKKQTNRQDFSTKRKNSFGKNKDLHTATGPIPTANSPSPTTPTSITSTNSNASFASGPGPALPSMRQTPEHVPLNNFNAQEVSSYLSNTWKEALDRYHDNNSSDPAKPEMYKPSEKAWGKPGGGPVWGQRANVMASGSDFFMELRKSSHTTNAHPGTANIKRTSSQRRGKGFSRGRDGSLDS